MVVPGWRGRGVRISHWDGPRLGGGRSWGIAMGLLWPVGVSIGLARAESVGTDPTNLAAGGAMMITSLVLCSGFRPAVIAWSLMEPEEVERPGFRYRVWGAWIGLVVGIAVGVWYMMTVGPVPA